MLTTTDITIPNQSSSLWAFTKSNPIPFVAVDPRTGEKRETPIWIDLSEITDWLYGQLTPPDPVVQREVEMVTTLLTYEIPQAYEEGHTDDDIIAWMLSAGLALPEEIYLAITGTLAKVFRLSLGRGSHDFLIDVLAHAAEIRPVVLRFQAQLLGIRSLRLHNYPEYFKHLGCDPDFVRGLKSQCRHEYDPPWLPPRRLWACPPAAKQRKQVGRNSHGGTSRAI